MQIDYKKTIIDLIYITQSMQQIMNVSGVPLDLGGLKSISPFQVLPQHKN